LQKSVRNCPSAVRNKHEQAQLEAEKALIRFPRSDMLLYELSLARVHLGSWKAADATLEMAGMLGKPSRIPILVERASLLRRWGIRHRRCSCSTRFCAFRRATRRACRKNSCACSFREGLHPAAADDALPSVAARVALLAAFSARSQGDFAGMKKACAGIPDSETEAAWCQARAAFLGR
jgi:hypothetical protein